MISHIPILCEKSKIPYLYIPSRNTLGIASETKKPTSVVLLLPPKSESQQEKFDTYSEKIAAMNPYL